jgi:hypothetical protein
VVSKVLTPIWQTWGSAISVERTWSFATAHLRGFSEAALGHPHYDLDYF